MEDEGIGVQNDFLTTQEAFVLRKAVPPVASHNASSPSLGTSGAAPNRKADDADERQASYRQAWDSISSTVQAVLAAVHQPFYQAVADRLSSVHYDAQVAYGPPDAPDGAVSSYSPSLDPAALVALRPFQTLQSRLYTGLLLLGGVTPSDHSGALQGLVQYLRARSCHVAHLRLASTARKGATDALRSLMKQLIKVELETADVGVLRVWHQQAAHAEQPIVVLLEEVEEADPAALEHLVLILSEWRSEVPLLLLLSLATTAASLPRLLPASALALLRTEPFPPPPTLACLQAVVSALFFQRDLCFTLGPAVVEWLYGAFFQQHATVTAFLAGLQVLLLHRHASHPLSPLDRLAGDRAALEAALRAMPVHRLRAAVQLPTGARQPEGSSKPALVSQLAAALMEAWERRRDRAAALQCLYLACQASGHHVVTLPELHRWSAHPAFFEDATRHANPTASPLALFGSGGYSTGAQAAAVKGQGHRLVSLASRGIKDLSGDARQRLVDAWLSACHSSTPYLRQVCSELSAVSAASAPPAPTAPCSRVRADGDSRRAQEGRTGGGEEERGPALVRSSPQKVAGAAGAARDGATAGEKRRSNAGRLSEDAERMQMMHRGQSAAEKRRRGLSAPVAHQASAGPVSDKLGTLLRRMVERFIAASRPTSLEELSCSNDCSALQQALSAPLQASVQQALVATHTLLPCSCCSPEGAVGPTLHDTATAYRLCSQFGDQVSIPEWYESFSAAVRGALTVPAREHAGAGSSAEAQARPAEREFPLERVRGKGRPRKRHKLPKQQEETQKMVEQEAPIAPPSEQERATLQARFFQATSELQLLGVVRPSAKRPEHVQKG